MSLNAEHIQAAKALPARLLRFFERYPPAVYQGRQHAPGLGPNKNAVPVSEVLVSLQKTEEKAEQTTDPATPPTVAKSEEKPVFNPFLPAKNYVTGKWRSPVYSLRRQAELCKMAREHGVEEWLPWSKKLSWVKEQRRLEVGSRVKGTGAGEKVKGHIWERTMKARLEKRRKAMEDMPRLIREWKERGHGRGWTKWPSGRASR